MFYTCGMHIEHREILELLDQSPLFVESGESELNRLAGLFQPVSFLANDTIFRCGDPSGEMYILYKGQVRLGSKKDKEDTGFAVLNRGDFFGEEALLYDDPRFYGAVALTDAVLLKLDVENYLYVYEELTNIERVLDVSVHSRKLSMQVSLPWLGKGEFVYVMTRRHPAILWTKWIVPLISIVIVFFTAFMLQCRWLPDRPYGWLLVGVGLPLILLWSGWIYFNWRNDYFLVTNKRVVWIEKVAFIYESRQEAPLRTVMSVGMRRSRMGSLLGYADVVVLTYVGTIRLRDLEHAEIIASLIESYWHRSESHNRREEAQLMARKLGEKLGFSGSMPGETQSNLTRQVARVSDEDEKEPGFFAWLFSDFIRLRYEGNGAITYRKHWFVLIRKTWLPCVLMAVTLGGLALLLGGIIDFIPITTGIVGVLVATFVCFIWIVYQYADWRNDIYRVTFDQIVDIDRKPLGKIRQRSAPLENILSIEYERLGFWGFLFNFGTVYISVGGTKLSFDYVYNPSEVQQDIFYRMGERLEQLQQYEIEGERERISEWIASYHRRVEESLKKRRDQLDDEDNTFIGGIS